MPGFDAFDNAVLASENAAWLLGVHHRAFDLGLISIDI